MSGLYSLSIDKSQGDAVLGGDFVGEGFVWANEVARATRVSNGWAVVRWLEGGN